MLPVTTYKEHQAFVDVLDDCYVRAYGTEYEAWPRQDLQAYAEHLMLGLEAMTDEEMACRFRGEPDPRIARDESVTFWLTILTA